MKHKIITVGLSDHLKQHLKDSLTNIPATLFSYATLEEAQQVLPGDDDSLIILNTSGLAEGCAPAYVERMRLTTHAPILVLAPDRLSGPLLKAGADMCVPEDLAPDTVTAHVLALLRRYTLYDHYDKRQPDRKAIQRGDIFIDPSRYTVLVRERPVHLWLREFSLLHYFMRNPQLVLTPEQICEGAWKMESGYGGDVSGPVAILRRAIEPNPKAPVYIQTVNQVGYRFTAHFSRTFGE